MKKRRRMKRGDQGDAEDGTHHDGTSDAERRYWAAWDRYFETRLASAWAIRALDKIKNLPRC